MLSGFLSVVVAAGWLLLLLATALRFSRTLRRQGWRASLALLTARQFLLPLALVVGLSVVRLGIVFVYPQQMAVVVSLLTADGIRQQPLGAGLHWVWPLVEHTVLYPRYWQTYTMSGRATEGQHLGADAVKARTKDNQEVLLDISMIYRIDPQQVVDLHRLWQDRYTEELLRPGLRALVRDQVARFTVGEVNSSKRTQLATELDRTVKEIAGTNGLIVKRLLLRNIAFTPEYASAVEQKQVELEGEIKAQHKARQIEQLARGSANRIEILAAAEAEAIKIKAQARAAARLIQAEAEAKALVLVGTALEGRQNLLTYRYISKLAPDVQAVVVPNDLPLIFPLPEMRLPPAPTPGAVAEELLDAAAPAPPSPPPPPPSG